MYSPGPGLWTLDLGPSGPDLGLDLDLDLSLTTRSEGSPKCDFIWSYEILLEAQVEAQAEAQVEAQLGAKRRRLIIYSNLMQL